jgi:hypothetical protein
MTDPRPAEEMRQAAREVLAEIVPGMLREALADPRPNGHRHGNGNGNGNGHAGAPGRPPDPGQDDTVPRVPAPPVAAVLRPSSWTGPAVPGEVIGENDPAPAAPVAPAAPAAPAADGDRDVHVEAVTIDTDQDLERFVRALLTRLENPRERRAIRTGRVRFGLRRRITTASDSDNAAGGALTIRVAKGAVTERAVRDAAAQSARLVLARGAVLTPLARDQARALGVEIEKERRC